MTLFKRIQRIAQARWSFAGVCLINTLLSVIPLVSLALGIKVPLVNPISVAILNLVGWSVLLGLVISRKALDQAVRVSAEHFGVRDEEAPLEELLEKLLKAVNRKNRALQIAMVEQRLASKDELSRSLEHTVGLAYKLLEAESAELSLFDQSSGMYHSAFVLGLPFRTDAQTMLSGAYTKDGVETNVMRDVLIQPIAFAGTILGTLRVGLKKGRTPSETDREIIKILALQSSLAMINLQYSEELLRMKQLGDESVKAKTGFLANLSHEIRGPLGIILNAVELVMDEICGALTTDQRETLGMVHSNGQHLLELINDVLDYAKAESGKVEPQRVDILVDDLLKDIVQVVSTQAEKKGHKLLYKPGVEAIGMHCDRRHARQMLINLLTNAIKYTPDKGTIEVWAERAPNGRVKLNVRDSGVGIDMANRGKVFTPFERVEHSYSITQVGTGLGMPLTRKLAELNGGQVDFSSEINRGSHFWIVLPGCEITAHEAKQAAPERVKVTGCGDKILIIAPDDGERSMLDRSLKSVGFDVVLTGNESEALDRLGGVSLCIIDNRAIDEQQSKFLSAIRKDVAQAALPIVLLSSRAFVFDVENYLKLGVDRCLSKPIELKELHEIVRGLIDARAAFKIGQAAKGEATSLLKANKGQVVH